ncbi:MAG: DASS family sodium-coupled anion symporter [Blastocatellia bacterium]|nr:DASS family sodium-coupled anion symporter [Blastocatellia bacterium]
MDSEIKFSSSVTIIERKNFWYGLKSRLPYPFALLGLAVGTTLAFTATPPVGLTTEGQRAIVIFVLCLLLWLWGRIPLVITSLLAITALPIAGVMKASRVYALFGNEAVFFILGAFILAAALMASGLSSRIALQILEKTGSTPFKLLLGIYLLNVFLAFFMSEHAVAAMMFPIIVEIARALKLKPKQSSYATAIFLAMAWGTSVGGITTFLGGARAPLAVGILKEMTGKSISFFDWFLAAFPITFLLTVAGLLLLVRFFPIDIESISSAKLVLRARNNQLGSLSYSELVVGFIMLLTIICWVFLGEEYGLANISLVAVIVLFFLRAVKWRDIEERVNWGIILMYGGAICLGAALADTGAAKWLVETKLSGLVSNRILIIAMFSFISYVLTEIMSNSAVVAALLPVALPLAISANFDAVVMVYVIAIPAGLGFALPMGTPANAIAYSSGYVERKDMILPGIIFGLLSWAIFTIVVIFLWPLIGIK